jgi:hypothetical protein
VLSASHTLAGSVMRISPREQEKLKLHTVSAGPIVLLRDEAAFVCKAWSMRSWGRWPRSGLRGDCA